MVTVVIIYVLLYLVMVILGVELMVVTPAKTWFDSGHAVFVPLEFFPGLILVLISTFVLYKALKEMEKQIEKEKQAFLKINELSPDSSIALRHEKHYEEFPTRLISIKMANGQEYFTDICKVDTIEDTWEVFYFELPKTSVAVLRHKRSKAWEVYSKSNTLS